MEESSKAPSENKGPQEEAKAPQESISTPETEKDKSGPINFKVILFGVLIALIITFTLQNNEEVEVNFLVWKFTSVRAVIIFLSFGLGWLSAFIYGIRHKKKKKL